ncbi:MAG: type VI secretion system Vgr family protein [Rhodothermales bacterium]
MAVPTFSLTVTPTAGTATVFSDITGDNGRIESFVGEDHISKLFEYRLKLQYTYAVVAGEPPPIDFSKLVNQSATLTMVQQALNVKAVGNTPAEYVPTTVNIEGVLSSFCVTKKVSDGVLACEAVLVPTLWRLGMSRGSRVFQNLTTQAIVTQILNQAGLTNYEFRLSASAYPTREFCMQYQESDLDFVQRLLEYEGIFYFFEGGKLVFADGKTLPPVADRGGVWFFEPSGAMTPTDDQVYSFIYSEQVVPHTVTVQDHDFESFLSEDDSQSGTDVNASGETHARVGTHREHGRFVVSKRNWVAKQSGDPNGKLSTESGSTITTRDTELTRLARIRAEELEAQRKTATAKSTISRIQPGHVIGLTDHFLFDDSYLITSVCHSYEAGAYKNGFTCLASAVQFRPSRSTPIPRVPGIMTAKVKGSDPNNDDAEPHIDDEGRYRVRFPFDPNAASAAEPSRPVRLAQPYAGKDYGMHFPNRGEVEMVVACLDGDPDRPLGLSVIPTPWKHAPVPNSKHGLRTQNPWTGSAAGSAAGIDREAAISKAGEAAKEAAITAGQTEVQAEAAAEAARTTTRQQLESAAASDATATAAAGQTEAAFPFFGTKSVIRTQLGHQLVMDDADGGANVGVTLQVGKKDNATGRNVYWNSRIDMGGYRHLSGLEKTLGIISTAVGYFRSAFTRDFPGMASEALGIIASQVTTDDYVDDTFGNTTPVGISISTDKDVNVKGGGGVNITSPNLFGMFSSSLVGDDSSEKEGQYRAEAISKFLVNLIWQEVINGTADELMETREDEKAYKNNPRVNPKVKAAFKWRENFKEQRVSALLFTLLQRTGVNIFSAGELKMASLQSTSVAAGQGGLALKSFGDIEQKADLGIELSSHQGIKLTTKGRPYKGKGVFKVLGKLGGAVANPAIAAGLKKAQAMLNKGQTKLSNLGFDESEMFSIELNNDNGDILLHTGGPKQKGEGDIMAHVEGKGDLKAFANDGQVHLWSGKDGSEGGIVMEVGPRKKSDENKRLATDVFGSRISQTDKVAEVFAKEKVRISTDDFVRGKSYVEIDKGDQIEIKCGQSSIVLKKNGDITLEGNNITLKGKKKVTIDGTDVLSKAKKTMAISGMKVSVDAKTQATLKGKVAVAVDGAIAQVKGKMVKVGS